MSNLFDFPKWVGTEAELETARSKAHVPFKSGSKSSSKDQTSKDQGAYTTDDEGAKFYIINFFPDTFFSYVTITRVPYYWFLS